MVRFKSLLFAAAAAIGVSASAKAGPIIRDAAQFESLTIEGVSLATSPRDAFNILYANGYSAGEVTAYEEWTHGSLNLVRGAYGGPEGYSSINLGRADGRLVLISQSLNQRGIDAGAEIAAVQSHFGIADDEQDCRMNTAGTSGACQVRDSDDRAAATMIFTMSAQSTMILRSISRPKELKKNAGVEFRAFSRSLPPRPCASSGRWCGAGKSRAAARHFHQPIDTVLGSRVR